jgi:hypothetical protein
MQRTPTGWILPLLLPLSLSVPCLSRDTPVEGEPLQPVPARLVGKLTLVHGRLLLEVAVIEEGPSLPLPAYPDAPLLVTLLESSALEKVERLARNELTRLPGLLATLKDDGSAYHPSRGPQVGTRGLEQHPLSLPAPDSREYFRIEGLLSVYHGEAVLFPLDGSRARNPWMGWNGRDSGGEEPPVVTTPDTAVAATQRPIPPWIRGRRTPEIASPPPPESRDPEPERKPVPTSDSDEVEVREF